MADAGQRHVARAPGITRARRMPLPTGMSGSTSPCTTVVGQPIPASRPGPCHAAMALIWRKVDALGVGRARIWPTSSSISAGWVAANPGPHSVAHVVSRSSPTVSPGSGRRSRRTMTSPGTWRWIEAAGRRVPTSTRARTRSGWRRASSWAIIPPIEMSGHRPPARRSPRRSTLAASSASVGDRGRHRAGERDQPLPRLSTRTTHDAPPPTGSTNADGHISPDADHPFRSSTGGPDRRRARTPPTAGGRDRPGRHATGRPAPARPGPGLCWWRR